MLICFSVLLAFSGCRDKGAHQMYGDDETYEVVMTTELKDEPEAIRKYEFYHSKDGCWPEIENAARISGLRSVRIYRAGNRLVMILTLPDDLTLEEMDKLYQDSSPKVKEWGELMGKFQQAPPFAEEGQVWVPMKRIHDFSGGKVH